MQRVPSKKKRSTTTPRLRLVKPGDTFSERLRRDLEATPRDCEPSRRERLIADFERVFRTRRPGDPNAYGVSDEQLEQALAALRSPLKTIFYGDAVRLAEAVESWALAVQAGRAVPLETCVSALLLQQLAPIEFRVRAHPELVSWLEACFAGRISATGVIARMLKESMANGVTYEAASTLTPKHSEPQIIKNVDKWRADARRAAEKARST